MAERVPGPAIWSSAAGLGAGVGSVRPPLPSLTPATINRLEGWFGRFKPRARLARGLKTETDARNFVALMARGMA